MFTLQLGDSEYQLVGPDGEPGEVVEYGLPATVEWKGDTYMAYVEDPDVLTPPFEDQVFKLVKVQAEVEEVEFEEGGTGTDDGEEEVEEETA